MTHSSFMNDENKFLNCFDTSCYSHYTAAEWMAVIVLSHINNIKHYTQENVRAKHNGWFVALRRRKTERRGCRCLWWKSMQFGGSSQYMLAAVLLAVRMLSWMWWTQWPILCIEGGCSLWLGSRLPAQSPSPINSFMHFPQKKKKKVWPTGNSDCN